MTGGHCLEEDPLYKSMQVFVYMYIHVHVRRGLPVLAAHDPHMTLETSLLSSPEDHSAANTHTQMYSCIIAMATTYQYLLVNCKNFRNVAKYRLDILVAE